VCAFAVMSERLGPEARACLFLRAHSSGACFMKSVCEWDWSAIAAWAQAIFSVVAIWAAFTLSKDERGHQRKHEFETQRRR